MGFYTYLYRLTPTYTKGVSGPRRNPCHVVSTGDRLVEDIDTDTILMSFLCCCFHAPQTA